MVSVNIAFCHSLELSPKWANGTSAAFRGIGLNAGTRLVELAYSFVVQVRAFIVQADTPQHTLFPKNNYWPS